MPPPHCQHPGCRHRCHDHGGGLHRPDLQPDGYNLYAFAAVVIALALFGAYRNYAVYPAIFSALAAFGGIRIVTIGTASGFNTVDPAGLYRSRVGDLAGHRLRPVLCGSVEWPRFCAVRPIRHYARVWSLIGTITPLARHAELLLLRQLQL